MKKTIRILLYILIFTLLVVAIAVAIGLYNPRAYEGMLSKFVYNKTGYQYSTSDLSIQLSPTIITIEGFELINPDWGQNSSLLSMQHAEITLELMHLLNNKMPYWKADFNGLDVQVAENDKSKINWYTSILAEQSKSEVNEPLILKDLLSFSGIRINKAKLTQKSPELVEQMDISELLLKRTSDTSVELEGAGIYQDQAVEINGTVDIDDQISEQEILQFALQAKGLGVDLNTAGVIKPSNFDQAKVSIKAKSENLEKLEALLETTFPTVTPLDVSLELQSSNGNYDVSEISLQMGETTLTGDVSYNAKNTQVIANFVSDKINLSSLTLEEKNEEIDSEEGAGYLETEIDWTWMNGLNTEVNVELGEVVANEFHFKDVSTKLRLANNILDIDELSAKYLYDNNTETEQFFVSDLIHISGTVKPLAEKTTEEDVQLVINISDQNASLQLEGNVNLNGVVGNSLKVNANATNLDLLSDYFQSDFSPYMPLKLNAHIEAFEKRMKVQRLTANFSESNITGDLNVNWLDKIVKVEGNIVSTLLDLSPILSLHEDERDIQKKKSTDISDKPSSKEKVFSDEAINWDWLESYNAEFDLDIRKLIINDNTFNKVISKLKIGEGELNIQPLQAHFADGKLNSKLTLTKVGKDVKLNSQLDAINLSLAAIGAADASVLEGGVTDVVMDISGQGNSMHQIASSLNGELVAEVQKGVIKNDAFEAIGTDIILEMLTMLNPFMKEDETTELECAAVKLTAKEGVLTSNNQMAIETTKMKIVGGGVINLDTEELEIGFSPSAKKGVGVNIGSLVKFVRLGGTLKNPHPEADPVGMLKSGAAIGAAVSTGGLSLLVEGLFKRATSSGSACNQVLSEKAVQDDAVDVLNKAEKP